MRTTHVSTIRRFSLCISEEVKALLHTGVFYTKESIVFDENPYPGIILDVDDGDVKTKCMASLGKKINFFGQHPAMTSIGTEATSI